MTEIIGIGLYTFFEALSVMFCLHYLYGEEPRLDRLAISYIITEITMMEIIYLLNLEQTWSLLIYPFMILYCAVRFEFDWRTIATNIILSIAILGIIQASIILLFYILFGINRVGVTDYIVINIIVFLITYLLLRKCRLSYLSKIIQINEKMVVMSALIVLMSVEAFLIRYKQNGGFALMHYIVLGVSIILIAVVAIDIGKHKIKAKELEAELRIHKMYEEPLRNAIDEIRARQHEFENHINTIYSQHCLYKTYDKLVEVQQKYCAEILEENRCNKIISKGNPVIRCFLYSKYGELERAGIDAEFRINIGELECGMPVHKMVELLENLIKNAREALQERGEGKLYIEMEEGENIIRIEVANESGEIPEERIKEFTRRGYSEKGESRGYGLYNVVKICKDYGGACRFGMEDKEGRRCMVFGIVINKPH